MALAYPSRHFHESGIRSSLRAELVGRGTAARSDVVEGSAQNPSTIESPFDGSPPHR